MTIFVYKGFDYKSGNTPIWVFSSIWTLEGVSYIKFSMNVSNEKLVNTAIPESCTVFFVQPPKINVIYDSEEVWVYVPVQILKKCKGDINWRKDGVKQTWQ